MKTLNCHTCGKQVEFSGLKDELFEQLEYYNRMGLVECIDCANFRHRINKRNRVLSTFEEPVRYG